MVRLAWFIVACEQSCWVKAKLWRIFIATMWWR